MENYIYLRAYLNENLGDDLFVQIIAQRYPERKFQIFAKTFAIPKETTKNNL